MTELIYISMLSFITILLAILIISIIILILQRIKNYKLTIDMKMLRHVTHLMPWIHAQITSSVEVTLLRYKIQVEKGELSKKINTEIYNSIINDIRTHFYGTIPKSLSEMLFKYLDRKQIEILMITEYRLQNNGFFTIA